MDSGADTAGEVFDRRPQKRRPGLDAGRERPPPPVSLWAGLQPDALGVVLRFLPCLADRARVRSVCRHWRAAARGHGVPAPLPLLVLPRFRLSSLSPGGALTAPRRAWMPREVAADHVRCVGSSDGWLVGVKQADGECFLVNAFSHELVSLPRLYNNSVYSVRIVALSAPPEKGSKCIVATFAFHWSKPELTLWKPGMNSCYVCRDALIAGHIDIAFYQGKLYMLWRFMPCLFAFELREDNRGVSVSRVEDCLIEALLPSARDHNGALSCNIVVWRGRLLLLIRYYGGSLTRQKVLKVEVFALDCSTKPYGLTEIHSFGQDCIFVGSGGCKSFPAGLHGGVEGDLIYFIPDYYNPDDTFVYSMRDGTVRPFAVESSHGNTGGPEDNLNFPVWLFPLE